MKLAGRAAGRAHQRLPARCRLSASLPVWDCMCLYVSAAFGSRVFPWRRQRRVVLFAGFAFFCLGKGKECTAKSHVLSCPKYHTHTKHTDTFDRACAWERASLVQQFVCGVCFHPPKVTSCLLPCFFFSRRSFARPEARCHRINQAHGPHSPSPYSPHTHSSLHYFFLLRHHVSSRGFDWWVWHGQGPRHGDDGPAERRQGRGGKGTKCVGLGLKCSVAF